jgi:hypothetical protein
MQVLFVFSVFLGFLSFAFWVQWTTLNALKLVKEGQTDPIPVMTWTVLWAICSTYNIWYMLSL